MKDDRTDSGQRLRSLYEPVGGVRAVFSSKVTDYAASRPDYPRALFDFLRDECRAATGARVADVGSGTGLLTRDLLGCGYRVVAVEPNPAMRAASDALLGGVRGYSSVEGCAESMSMADGSVELITAAQAFHWFDVEKARAEFQRVLAPGGSVVLIWNDRVLEDPLHAALDEIFAEHGGERRAALVAHEDRSGVPRFFGPSAMIERSWPHQHALGLDGLLALVFSRSYMPGRDTADGLEVQREVKAIFGRMAKDGAVAVRYRTNATAGSLVGVPSGP